MNNFVDFWVGLGYNGWLFLLLILLFFAHLIMIILRSTVLTTKKRPATVEPEEGVSVIITCSNKAELLKQNLEAFLTQEYPKYEVIVVDECSEDETQDVLSDLQQKYPHLKTTRIFPETKFRRTKKIAINIGVLAAQYDVLLFSEINCKPGSGPMAACDGFLFYARYGGRDRILQLSGRRCGRKIQVLFPVLVVLEDDGAE